MSIRPCPALVLLLLVACGDSTAATSDSGSASSTGSTSSSTSGAEPVPTTSLSPTTGASDSLSGTTSSGADDGSSTDPVTPTEGATSTSTTSTSTTTGDTGDTSTTGDATDSTSGGTGGCDGPEDCPEPPECHLATCEAGVCGEDLAPAGNPCQAGVCDGLGACVECLAEIDCPQGQICLDAQCVAPSCADGLHNGQETDIDCGGPSCPPCGPGGDCQTGSDCVSGVCTGGACQPASCEDGVANGDETGVDCGGPTCPQCQPGGGCQTGSDCASGVCTDGACQAPTCNDNVQNGQETGVDCGGPTCPKCQPGGGCQTGSDCASGVCTGGACQAPSCNDGVKNGQETDVDCGGPTCPKCQTGDDCQADSDCAGGVCQAGVCVDPGPACASAPADPATGQRCPLFMPCSQSSECGVFQGCQQWFCNASKTCELNALSNCGTTKGGGCNAGVVFVQHEVPPVAKRFLPPDGVDFREVTSLAFTVYNNTADTLRLDKLPVTLEVMGGGSQYDVSSVKIFDNSGGPEHGPGDILVCLTADPFSFPANGVLGPCAGSSFSQILPGQSNQFIVNLAFAKEKTFIAGRSYRLKLVNPAGVVFRIGLNGPEYAGTRCGVPPEGFVGAWVTAQKP
jgi:hypothetical protein